MKKFLVALLALGMASLTFAACGQTDEMMEEDTDTASEDVMMEVMPEEEMMEEVMPEDAMMEEKDAMMDDSKAEDAMMDDSAATSN